LVDRASERLGKGGTVRQRDQDGLIAVHVQLGQHGSERRRPID
jgi:hypothetical protein